MLFLYDDERARGFEPFALTRPLAEMRAGAELIRLRWEQAVGDRAAGLIVASHLADFEELDAPPVCTDVVPAGAIVANARCVPALAASTLDANVWTCGGRVAAVRLERVLDVRSLHDGARTLDEFAPTAGARADLRGRWIDEVWDLVRDLGAQLAEDIASLGPRLQTLPAGAFTTLGAHPLFVEHGATIEPYVLFDLSAGPVLVRQGATVQALTRIVGPCYVGRDSLVGGDKIANSAIGDVCRVHGELSTTTLLGHSNKAHDGFVGHSYLGRWVNLGAGTTTSNLKNTYGTVSLWTPRGLRDTGLQFLGTLFGDHVKTGIGLRLTTGSVIGTGANVYDRMPPKAVAPFSWGGGEPYATYDADKFLQVAERAMARRHVTLGGRGRRMLACAHAQRWTVGR